MLMRMGALQRTCKSQYSLARSAAIPPSARRQRIVRHYVRFPIDRSANSCKGTKRKRPQQRAFSPFIHQRLLSHVIVVFLVVDMFALVVLGRLYIVLLIRADMSIRTRFSFLAVDVGLATLETTDLAIGQLT